MDDGAVEIPGLGIQVESEDDQSDNSRTVRLGRVMAQRVWITRSCTLIWNVGGKMNDVLVVWSSLMESERCF